MPKLFLSEAQICALLDYSANEPRDHAYLHIAVSTGLRVSDILALRLDQIVNSDGSIAHSVVVRQRKTGRRVEARLTPACRQAIARYLLAYRPKGPYLFTGWVAPRTRISTRMMDRSTIHKMIKKYLKRLFPAEMLRGNACHITRRSVAKIICDRTGRVESAAAFLGHSSVASTMAYLDPGELNRLAQAVVEEMPWSK